MRCAVRGASTDAPGARKDPRILRRVGRGASRDARQVHFSSLEVPRASLEVPRVSPPKDRCHRSFPGVSPPKDRCHRSFPGVSPPKDRCHRSFPGVSPLKDRCHRSFPTVRPRHKGALLRSTRGMTSMLSLARTALCWRSKRPSARSAPSALLTVSRADFVSRNSCWLFASQNDTR